MKNKRNLLEYISEISPDSEALPILPVIELAGDRRVLIESHLGVIFYSTESVGIRVKFGTVNITGCGLLMKHMTKNKLVISGRIDQITLIRKEHP